MLKYFRIFISENLNGEGTLEVFYRKAVFNFQEFTYKGNTVSKGEIMVTPDGKTIYAWITQTDPNIPSTYSFTGTRI